MGLNIFVPQKTAKLLLFVFLKFYEYLPKADVDHVFADVNHTLSLSHIQYLFFKPKLSSLFHTVSLSFTNTHFSLFLSHTHSLSFTNTHTFSLSQTHTLSLFHKYTLFLSFTHTLSFFLSHTHTHTLSLSKVKTPFIQNIASFTICQNVHIQCTKMWSFLVVGDEGMYGPNSLTS